MKHSKMLLYLIFFYCIIGCSSSNRNEDPTRLILDQIGDNSSSNYYLIVPVKACSGCVEEILTFIKKNVKNSKITFVLTSNEGKILDLLLTPEQLNSGNILLDKKGLFEKSGIVSTNFLLLKTDGKEFTERKTLNAVNLISELTALDQLINK